MLGYFWGSKPKSAPDEPSKEQQEKINWVEETKKIEEEETRKKLEEQERLRKIEERRLKLIEDGIEEWELEEEENQDDQTISEGQNSSDSEHDESESQNLSASAILADMLNDMKDLQNLNATETSATLVINHLRDNVSTEAIGEVDESRLCLRHSSIDCDDTNPYLENIMLSSTDLLAEDFMRLSAFDEDELIVPPKPEPKEPPPNPIPEMPQDLNASWFPFWRNNTTKSNNQASTEIEDIKKQVEELKALLNAGVQPTGAYNPPPAPGGGPPPPSPGGPPPPGPGNGPPPPGNGPPPPGSGPPPPGSGPPGPGKRVAAVKKVEEKVVEPNEVVLTRLVAQSDGYGEAMKKQGVEIYLKYFSNKPKGMVALLNDYPYLVTQYPIDPDKTLKIMGWWEKWVWKEISELMKDDPKGLATLKKNKLIEIQKTENEEQVKEECIKMKQVIKKRQDDLLIQAKMKGKHIDFNEVVQQIQSRGKAKECQARQEQEAEQKRMLEEKMQLLNGCAADDIDDDMFS